MYTYSVSTAWRTCQWTWLVCTPWLSVQCCYEHVCPSFCWTGAFLFPFSLPRVDWFHQVHYAQPFQSSYTISYDVWLISHPHQQGVCVGTTSSLLSWHCDCLIITALMALKWDLIVILICSLMTCDTKYLSFAYWHLCILFREKSIPAFHSFLSGVVFLLLTCKNSLYILDTNLFFFFLALFHFGCCCCCLFVFWDRVSNLWSSCLSCSSARAIDMCHHAKS
jgi:hypothetical protein